MGFVRQAGVGVVLIALTLNFQSAGMALLIRWARAAIEGGTDNLTAWRSSILMVRFTAVMIALQILQIMLWASFYRWKCLPTWESSFYFSATSYSTVGYGDIVLPPIWRSLGPIESVTGIIMCGISVSALFAITLRLIENETRVSAPRK